MNREAFFDRAREQLETLRDQDPEVWKAYRSEARTWRNGTDGDVLRSDDEPGWWAQSDGRLADSGGAAAQ